MTSSAIKWKKCNERPHKMLIASYHQTLRARIFHKAGAPDIYDWQVESVELDEDGTFCNLAACGTCTDLKEAKKACTVAAISHIKQAIIDAEEEIESFKNVLASLQSNKEE